MAATVTITIEQLATELGRTAEQVEKAFRSESLKKKISIIAVASVKDNFQKGQSPEGVPWRPLAMRAGRPLLDTGRLRASIRADVTTLGVTVGANAIQARLMQEGGIVRAKKKFLAIPLTPAARRVTSPRQIPDLHFQGTDAGGALMNDEGEALFALVKSVKIPARPYLGFGLKVLDLIERMIGDEIAKTVGGG